MVLARWDKLFQKCNHQRYPTSHKATFYPMLLTLIMEPQEIIMKIEFQSYLILKSLGQNQMNLLHLELSKLRFLQFLMVMVDTDVLNFWEITCTTLLQVNHHSHKILKKHYFKVSKMQKNNSWDKIKFKYVTNQVLALLLCL